MKIEAKSTTTAASPSQPPLTAATADGKTASTSTGNEGRTVSQQADREARYARAFAQVTAVMMRDTSFRQLPLGALEWLVLPPLLAGQWRLGQTAGTPRMAGKGQPPAAAGSMLIPVTVALWARVSPEVDRRLSGSLDKPLYLSPGEWTSGDIVWLIALAGDVRSMPRFLSVLRDKEFQGREVKLRARGAGDAVIVRTLADHVTELQRATTGIDVPSAVGNRVEKT